MNLRIALGAMLACVWGCAGPSSGDSAAPPSGEISREVPGPAVQSPPPSAVAEPTEATEAAEAATPEAVPETDAGPGPRLKRPPPEYFEVTRLYGQASAALREGDSERAEALLDEALKVQPDHIQATIAKVRLCREAGRDLEAVDAVNRALASRPRHSFLLYLKAEALYDAGEPDEALEALLPALDQGDDVPEARYLRARILGDSGDREGTLAAIEDSLMHGFRDMDRLETDESFEFLEADPDFRTLVSTTREELRLARENALLPDTPKSSPKHPESTELPTLLELQGQLRGAIATREGREVTIDVVGMDGKPLRLSDSLGHVVVVELWGTWSRLSTRELAHVDRLRKAMGEIGVDVLTLCREVYHDPSLTRERVEVDVRAYRKDFGITAPCAVIDEGTAGSLGVTEYPTTIFVGMDGKAYLQATGYKDYEVIEELTRILLEEGPPPPPEAYRPSEEPEEASSAEPEPGS